jgi:hypothetical protein
MSYPPRTKGQRSDAARHNPDVNRPGKPKGRDVLAIPLTRQDLPAPADDDGNEEGAHNGESDQAGEGAAEGLVSQPRHLVVGQGAAIAQESGGLCHRFGIADALLEIDPLQAIRERRRP